MNTDDEIRLARPDDVESIVRFIDRHWSRGHVLTISRELFDWQYRSRHRDGYNFVLARQAGELLGVLGYLRTADLDPELRDRATVWLALWKVRDDQMGRGLGTKMLGAVTDAEPHVAMGTVGVGNPRQLGMYEALGYQTGELTHFVVFHPASSVRLARIPDGVQRPIAHAGDAELEAIERGDIEAVVAEIDGRERVPFKSGAYVRARYLDHPFYDYGVHLVRRSDRPAGLLVTRVAEHDGAAAVRIVDFIGDPRHLEACGPGVHALIEERGAEYADLWIAGADVDLERAGFAPVDPDGPMIVPNHFEPYVLDNQRIHYAIRTVGAVPYALFRADGDQDRPNRIAP